MIKRAAEGKLRDLAKGFPAVAVIGPRQSGKTTLVRKVFPNKPYILLEDPNARAFATKDPKGFLAQYPDGAILDEAQKVPEIFSYLQGLLDEKNTPGLFILTGSQNFFLMEQITQSLAGRIALMNLLPLTIQELKSAGITFESYEEYLVNGFYPRIYDKHISPTDLYSNYVRTYIDRDVRMLKNIQDLSAFHTFLKLCAHRIGSLVNTQALASDCGITYNTAKAWLSVLETSFIIFLLKPHHKNFNKRLVKSPKLYFYDCGLAAYLADIEDKKHMTHHTLRGPLFESFILADLLKQRFNQGLDSNLFFWRDQSGHEIDCLIERSNSPMLIEIKSGKTISENFFDQLKYYQKLSSVASSNLCVVYGGNAEQKRSDAHVISWGSLENIFSTP